MGILNIVHRGYSGKFYENTMLAFEKAIEYKADGIEIITIHNLGINNYSFKYYNY